MQTVLPAAAEHIDIAADGGMIADDHHSEHAAIPIDAAADALGVREGGASR